MLLPLNLGDDWWSRVSEPADMFCYCGNQSVDLLFWELWYVFEVSAEDTLVSCSTVGRLASPTLTVQKCEGCNEEVTVAEYGSTYG